MGLDVEVRRQCSDEKGGEVFRAIHSEFGQ